MESNRLQDTEKIALGTAAADPENAAEAITGDEKRATKRHPIRTVCILIVCAALLIGGGYAFGTFGMPAIRYHIGVDKLENGKYAEALQLFEQLGDYRDVSALIPEAKNAIEYENAALHAEKGEYTAAQEIYEKLGDYRDSRSLADEMKYLNAKSLLERKEWETAINIFQELGNYRDAAELAVLAENEVDYAFAKECVENENYLKANEIFKSLGDFKDSKQQAEQAYRFYQVDWEYQKACDLYKCRDWVGAANGLLKIQNENYKDTAVMLNSICDAIVSEIEEFAEQGETVKMLSALGAYKTIDEAKAEELKEKIIAEGSFDLDYSHFNLTYNAPITHFSKNTTAEEFATLVLSMYLNGKNSVTLLPQGTFAYNQTIRELLRDNFLGVKAADELLSIHSSIYTPYITYHWDTRTGIFEKVTITLSENTNYSHGQNTAYVKKAQDFCDESVRALMEIGLLRDTMSNKQKAMIINAWVGYYLTYDDSLEIHNAGVAVEEKLGVCESYAALFNQMCNLAGVPTWGQTGYANEGHVWSIQLDENGTIFYSDSTWSDRFNTDYSKPEENGDPSVENFCYWLVTLCDAERKLATTLDSQFKDVSLGYYDRDDLNIPDSYYDEFLQEPWVFDDYYLWKEELWDTHTANRSAEKIIAFYQRHAA